jgi:exonuclease III
MFQPSTTAFSPLRKLKLLSYNIDGLNDCLEELGERMMMIVSMIVSEDPHVIHLQEVVPSIVPLITKTLLRQDYICSENFQNPVRLGPYFTLSFIKKQSAFKNIEFQRISYSTKESQSTQGRDILLSRLQIHDIPFLFINCHLESCGTAFRSPQSLIRQAQLKTLFNMIQSHSQNTKGSGILSGDLNLRDNEANYVLKEFSSAAAHPQIIDFVEHCEQRQQKQQHSQQQPPQAHKPHSHSKSKSSSSTPVVKLPPTWIMPGKPTVQCRFDRCYYTSSLNSNESTESSSSSPSISLQPESYRLLGKDEIFPSESRSGYATPSDHFGLVLEFNLNIPITVGTHSDSSSSNNNNNISFSSMSGNLVLQEPQQNLSQMVSGQSSKKDTKNHVIHVVAEEESNEGHDRTKLMKRKRADEEEIIDLT